MIRRSLRYLLLPVAAALLVACGDDDATAPGGEASVVAIRAYVDANGSGVYDAGDAAITGAAIHLTREGQAALEATTDAEGLATFEGVTPGSYSATFAGTVPAGAVLSTATSPVVVAPFEGDTVTSEFRFAFLPGTVGGTIFRDNDASGTYTTGDTPAPGLAVRIFTGTDTTATPVATTTTDASGQYTFTTLRPGSYTVVVTPFPTIQIVGGNAIPVTVGANVQGTYDVRFTGQLVISIAEAKVLPVGTRVATVGVATVNAGSTSPYGSRTFYIQDATSGVMVFFSPSTSAVPVALGDSVRVLAVVNQFGGEVELDSAQVTLLKSGATVPTPRVVTGAQIAARSYEGQLVKTLGAEVVSVGGGTSASFNVTMLAGDGTQFTLRVAGSGTGLTRTSFIVGGRYDVTGILGSFNGAAQLKPRYSSDLVAATSGIALVKQAPIGSPVTAVGIVTAGTGPFGTRTFYIQDPFGGIMGFFSPSASAVPVVLGDSVRVTGKMNAFSGELEIDTAAVTVLKSGATVPAPMVLTLEQVNARTYEGMLATVNNVQVVSVSGSSTSTAYTVIVKNAAGTQTEVRVAGSGAAIPWSTWIVGRSYNVTGILSAFTPSGGTVRAQLKPRSLADVVTLP